MLARKGKALELNLSGLYKPWHNRTMPELWDNFGNAHPNGQPIWSFMFISIACGAISGFHATQAPMMARCAKSEKEGQLVFYGSMVAEGIIAVVAGIAAAAGLFVFFNKKIKVYQK